MNRIIYNNLITEILEVERLFAEMASEKGLKEAFLAFAAKDAVLGRNNRLFKGKAGISEYYDSQTFKDVSFHWKPDYIDVSSSGDMAYSYGDYKFSALTAENEPIEAAGIFHTVWKRQSDGSWKYVWD